MLHNLKNAAENYLNGLSTADEMLASLLANIHPRWENLVHQDPDGQPDPALDVDVLARAIHNMNVPPGAS